MEILKSSRWGGGICGDCSGSTFCFNSLDSTPLIQTAHSQTSLNCSLPARTGDASARSPLGGLHWGSESGDSFYTSPAEWRSCSVMATACATTGRRQLVGLGRSLPFRSPLLPYLVPLGRASTSLNLTLYVHKPTVMRQSKKPRNISAIPLVKFQFCSNR